MAIRRQLTIIMGRVVALSLSATMISCNHHASPNPFAQPNYGNPWTTPNGLAAPRSSTYPYPPATAPTAAVPAVPNLPPPQGFPGSTVTPSTPSAVTPSARVQGPNWNNPGTVAQQRQRANVFDPFANNEAGPEIIGGRPRDFQKPMNEATRAQPYRDTQSPF
jgi:hypothetical protein